MIRIPRLVVFALAVPVVVTVARPLAKEIGRQLKKVGGLIEDAVEELNRRDAEAKPAEAESEKKVDDTEKPASESSTSTSGQPAEPAEVEHPEEPVGHEQAASSEGAPAMPRPEESVKQSAAPEAPTRKAKRVPARRPAVKDKVAKVAKESPKRTSRRRARDFETG